MLSYAVVWLPERMVQQVYHGNREKSVASGNNYAKLVDDYRKTLIQIIGGAFLLYTLYLTQRRTKAAEETLRTTQESLEVTRKSLEVTRETQITDRFTKAITQLGATNNEGAKQIETRLGAIYALERIAKDSEPDYWPIMEILTAYVRHNAAWRQPEVTEVENRGNDIPQPDKDIEAIMTVISRRSYKQDQGRLDLSHVDLRGVKLTGAHLGKVVLSEAHLEQAELIETCLDEANLNGAHFENALLYRAHLNGALLDGAHLNNAQLGTADLHSTQLSGTHLEGASLRFVNGLTQEQIEGAYGDKKTTLPKGIEPEFLHPGAK